MMLAMMLGHPIAAILLPAALIALVEDTVKPFAPCCCPGNLLLISFGLPARHTAGCVCMLLI